MTGVPRSPTTATAAAGTAAVASSSSSSSAAAAAPPRGQPPPRLNHHNPARATPPAHERQQPGRGGGGGGGEDIDANTVGGGIRQSAPKPHSKRRSYAPAASEDYVIKHAVELGLDSVLDPSGCVLWQAAAAAAEGEPSALPAAVRVDVQNHVAGMKEYNARVEAYTLSEHHNYTDLRHGLRHQSNSAVCSAVDLRPDATFTETLSLVPGQGLVEPLLPPLRHPGVCTDREKYLMDLSYVVHDFGAMCRGFQPHSRTIFVDMGASLAFHVADVPVPTLQLLELYRKFGIVFDHIYAYEVTRQEPADVFGKLVPPALLAAYHWINTGVDAKPGSILNPWTMIKQHFVPDDLIIVKLDIDNSSVEMPLAKQLLNDPVLLSLVDHFYFEHHVHLEELAPAWASSMEGTVYESLQLFSQLREKGVAAHSWV